MQQQFAQQNGYGAPPTAPPSTVTDETVYRQTQEQLATWCASDRQERRAVIARKAEADAALAAERAKKADEAKTRADYIKKNCKTLMKPKGPPAICIDGEGFLRDCSAPPEVYVECPATGPKDLRGVIGQGVMSNQDPSRVARARSSPPVAASASEPTKDERCHDLDGVAK